MNVLFAFKCGGIGCGWTEDVGVDVRTGVVIKGDITLICPKCGSITVISNLLAMVPVRFMPQERR